MRRRHPWLIWGDLRLTEEHEGLPVSLLSKHMQQGGLRAWNSLMRRGRSFRACSMKPARVLFWA